MGGRHEPRAAGGCGAGAAGAGPCVLDQCRVAGVRRPSSAIVAFGLLLALAWLRLAAGDVAMTEAAVGSGVTGAVLIAAAMRLRLAETEAPLPGVPLRLLALLLSGLVTAALAGLVLWTTGPAPSLANEAVQHLPALGDGQRRHRRADRLPRP